MPLIAFACLVLNFLATTTFDLEVGVDPTHLFESLQALDFVQIIVTVWLPSTDIVINH